MKSLPRQIVLFVSILLFFPTIFAAHSLGLGRVANNMMEPVSIVTEFVLTACYIIGASFLFTAMIKYFEHRRNPLASPLGTVAFLVFAGILLILLPLLTSIYNQW